MDQEYISGDPNEVHPLARGYSTSSPLPRVISNKSSPNRKNNLTEFSMSFRGELPVESDDDET